MQNFDLMIKLIGGSLTYKRRITMTYFERIIHDVINPVEQRMTHGHLVEDTFFQGVYGLVSILSEAFGRTIAQIQFKDGLMYKRPDLEAAILSEMKPGDILWDKTRYKISGMLIPGHWNHNAVWIGTKQDLIDLGIWDHPYVKPYQTQIEQGKSVIEALRFGVVLNTMAHFLNVDDLAVARLAQEPSEEERRQIILRAMRFMGTPYTFNFDIARADSVICSQLVMIAYPDIDWKQEKLIGNWSTTPDLLAQETLLGGPLTITQLWRNAERIHADPAVKMAQLLKAAE